MCRASRTPASTTTDPGCDLGSSTSKLKRPSSLCTTQVGPAGLFLQPFEQVDFGLFVYDRLLAGTPALRHQFLLLALLSHTFGAGQALGERRVDVRQCLDLIDGFDRQADQVLRGR